MCMPRRTLNTTFTLHAIACRRMPSPVPRTESRGVVTRFKNRPLGKRTHWSRPAASKSRRKRLPRLDRHVDCAQRNPWQRMMFGQSKDWREKFVHGTNSSSWLRRLEGRPEVWGVPFGGRQSHLKSHPRASARYARRCRGRYVRQHTDCPVRSCEYLQAPGERRV
jgi:hypothetical protein